MGRIWPKTCLLAMVMMLGAVAAQAQAGVSHNTPMASNPSRLSDQSINVLAQFTLEKGFHVPDVPNAFVVTMKDRELQAESERLKLELCMMDHKEIEALFKTAYASLRDVVKRTSQLLNVAE